MSSTYLMILEAVGGEERLGYGVYSRRNGARAALFPLEEESVET